MPNDSQGSGLGGRCRPAGVGRCGVRPVRLRDPGAAGMPRRGFPPALREDRAFSFCRILYTSVRRERSGGGWRTDYPVRRDQPDDPPLGTDQDPRARLTGNGEPTHTTSSASPTKSLFECPLDDGVGCRHDRPERRRGRTPCASICSRAGSCGWTISGGRRRGSSGRARWRRCSRHRSTPFTDVPLDRSRSSAASFVVTEVPQITNIRLLAQVARP